MKYKVGSIVKVKPKKWWEKVISRASKILINDELVFFPETMATQCCGKEGAIIEINKTSPLPYKVKFNNESWQFCDDWLEIRNVQEINLKQMRNEI